MNELNQLQIAEVSGGTISWDKNDNLTWTIDGGVKQTMVEAVFVGCHIINKFFAKDGSAAMLGEVENILKQMPCGGEA